MEQHLRQFGIAAAVTLLGTIPALGGGIIDVELQNRARVKGRLDTVTELESYRVLVPQDALLSARVKGKGRNGPVPTLVLCDPQDQQIDPGNALDPTGQQLTDFIVPTPGLYRVDVAGDGALTGDYSFDMSWRYPEPAPLENAAFGSTDGTITFRAEAGSTAKIFIKMAERGTTGYADRLTGPDALDLDLAPPQRKIGRRHKPKNLRIPTTGEYTVHFKVSAADAVVRVARVRMKLPRRPSGRFNSKFLDRPKVGEGRKRMRAKAPRRFVGRRFDVRGGSAQVPKLDESQLVAVDTSGTGLDVPENAVPFPVGGKGTLCIATNTKETLRNPSLLPAAGVQLELEALDDRGREKNIVEGETVDVEAAFDVGAFFGAPIGDELRVVHATDDGDTTILSNVAVDVDAGKVTFPAPSFSRFQVVSGRLDPAEVVDRPQAPIDLSVARTSDDLYVATDTVSPTNSAPGVKRQRTINGPFERFVGGGFLHDDGSDRLQFDFKAAPYVPGFANDPKYGVKMVAVHAMDNGNVVVVTSGSTRLDADDVPDQRGSIVYLVDTLGAVTRVAGSGGEESTFDNAIARNVGLPEVSGVASSTDDSVIYIVSDHFDHQKGSSDEVYSITLHANLGEIRLHRVAGGGSSPTSGVPPRDIFLVRPRSILVDQQDRLYVGDVDWLLRFDLDNETTTRIAGTNFGEDFDEKVPDDERPIGGQGAPLKTVVTGRLEDLAFARHTEDILYAADFSSGIIWRFDVRRDRAFVAAGRRLSLEETLLTRNERTEGSGTSQDNVEFPFGVVTRQQEFCIADNDNQLIVIRKSDSP